MAESDILAMSGNLADGAEPAAMVTPVARPKTSSRDPKHVHAALTAWLAGLLPTGADPVLSELAVPGGSGMSSETLLFDATWRQEGESHTAALVARIAPDAAAMPVFPAYHLERQFRTIQEVGALTTVPVPNVRWLETDRAVLGEQFFVMDQITGVVPTDIPPYAVAGWVKEGTADERARLSRASVEVLAKLHAIEDAADRFAFLQPHRRHTSGLRQHVTDTRYHYDWTVSDGLRSPLIERTFDWLETHWPAHEGQPVLSWGDSRIGNIMYRDFSPVAVLDWEMAAVGPRELDAAWMAFMHFFFERMLEKHGLSGLPDMLRPPDIAETYEELCGYELRDLPFYLTYSALRYAIIMFRIGRRQLLFGEMEMPNDPDDMTGIRVELEELLAGDSPLTSQ